MAEWVRTDEQSRLGTTPTGRFGIMVVGLVACEPCELVKRGVELFHADHPASDLLLFKVDKSAWPDGVVTAHGRPVRYFPTTIGFVDGEEVFRTEGAAIRRDDAELLRRRFARAHGGAGDCRTEAE